LWLLHKKAIGDEGVWKREAGRASFPQVVGKHVESQQNQGDFLSFPQGKPIFSVENFLMCGGKCFWEKAGYRKTTKFKKAIDSLKCSFSCKTVGWDRRAAGNV